MHKDEQNVAVEKSRRESRVGGICPPWWMWMGLIEFVHIQIIVSAFPKGSDCVTLMRLCGVPASTSRKEALAAFARRLCCLATCVAKRLLVEMLTGFAAGALRGVRVRRVAMLRPLCLSGV